MEPEGWQIVGQAPARGALGKSDTARKAAFRTAVKGHRHTLGQAGTLRIHQ